MRRVRLRASKNPWTVISPETTHDRNIIGNNVGNLVYGHAAHRTLTTSTTEVEANGYAATAAEARIINDEYDVFVVPLANALRPSFATHLERLTELINALKVPVVVLGIGAQTSTSADLTRLDPLADITKRFAAAVLERSASIGVRGEVTASYLNQLGFRDVEVIGCPSMFIWGADLPVPRQPTSIDSASAVTVTVSPYVKQMGPIVDHHLDAYPQLDYIAQDRDTLERMLWGPRQSDEGESSGTPVYLNHRLFQEQRAKFFVDPWTWFDHLRTRDVVFGTRIHGSISAVVSGTPAIVLAHDSRTLELARYHEIPHRLIAKLPQNIDVADLYQAADFGPMISGHAARFSTYLDFLAKNGLDSVFAPGQSPEAFDAKVTEARFPGPVEAPPPGSEALQLRLRRLYDASKTQDRKKHKAKARPKDEGAAREPAVRASESRSRIRVAAESARESLRALR